MLWHLGTSEGESQAAGSQHAGDKKRITSQDQPAYNRSMQLTQKMRHNP